jgi:hypothetical protein
VLTHATLLRSNPSSRWFSGKKLREQKFANKEAPLKMCILHCVSLLYSKATRNSKSKKQKLFRHLVARTYVHVCNFRNLILCMTCEITFQNAYHSLQSHKMRFKYDERHRMKVTSANRSRIKHMNNKYRKFNTSR